MTKGSTRKRYSSIRPVPISDWTRVALPSMMMSLPGCCFNLVISSTTFSEIMVDSFQGASSSDVETTYLCMLLRIGPGPSPVVCFDQPGQSISYVTRPRRYVSPWAYCSVMYCILSGLFVFCHH